MKNVCARFRATSRTRSVGAARAMAAALRSSATERGSSIVTFVVALPLVLVFLFAIVDVGRVVFLHMALADAAHAVCAAASDPPERGASALREVALRAAPSLASDGLVLTVTASYGEQETVFFAHHVYNDASGAFEERAARVGRAPVRVELGLEGRYLTPLGPLLAVAEGGAGDGFSYRARCEGVVDAVTEGGAS